MRRVLFFVIIVTVVILNINQVNADGYSCVKIDFQGKISFGAGKGLFGDRPNVNVWAISGNEVGATIGPKIGPFNIGLGASIGCNSVNNVGVTYTNIDLGFELDVWEVHWGKVRWQAYSLHKHGHGAIKDFTFSCNWFSLVTSVTKDQLGKETVHYFPIGIVSHNTRSYNEETDEMKFNSFWGLFIRLGEIGRFSSNRLVLAINVLDGKTLWGFWRIGF